jgi:HlyD family secretion protein
LLFVIRPDNYEAALEQAVASLNSAKADYANAKAAVGRAQTSLKQDSVEYFRSKQLYEDKAIPKQQFEQARLKYQLSQSNLASAKEQRQAAFFRVQNAEASVKQARDQLRQTRVYASMDGTVTALDVQLGERVVGTGMQMGTEVMRIADLSRMLVEVEVNENDIVDLQLGDTAKVEVDAYPERVFKGKVVEIGFAPKSAQGGGSGLGGAGGGSSTNDQVTNYPVKVLIQPSSYENDSALMGRIPEHQSPFRPSMSAVVNIYTDRAEDVVSVPIQAVTLDRQTGTGATDERIVFRYDSSAHKVRRQPVTTGISDDTYMAIQEGLAAGTPIVTGPYNTVTKELRDGMTVKERQADQEREKDEAEE